MTGQRRRRRTLPIVLQWNVNGLRSRLPDLRTRLRQESFDLLALQETGIRGDEGRISGYVSYHSKSVRPDGRSRASIYVRRSLYHCPVNLDSLSSRVAEYVAVTLRVQEVDVTVLSIYVRPGVHWDPRELIQVRQRCASIVLLCGDFNAHCESWGDFRTDRRGEELCDVMLSMNLVALNDGRATFLRPRVSGSVLDITFASPESRSQVSWCPEADSWGSDHLPIRLVPACSRFNPARSNNVTI